MIETIVVAGLAIGLVLAVIAGFIREGFLSERLRNLVEAFIDEAYEPAAYKAAKELTETGEMGHDCARWARIWKPIMKLRWLRSESVRNRLERVHYSRFDKFPYVKFELDWQAGLVHISMQSWIVLLLDERQQEVGRLAAKTEAEAYSTGRNVLAEPHQYVRHDRHPKAFLVLDPKGKVVGPEETVETEP